MTVDESHREIWDAMQRQRQIEFGAGTFQTLKDGDGGDNSGGMEARIARLEASMEFVKAELAKLSSLPVEMARLSERVSHLPAKNDVDAAIDRAATRTQRTVAVAGGVVTLAVAAMNYLPKLLGHG